MAALPCLVQPRWPRKARLPRVDTEAIDVDCFRTFAVCWGPRALRWARESAISGYFRGTFGQVGRGDVLKPVVGVRYCGYIFEVVSRSDAVWDLEA